MISNLYFSKGGKFTSRHWFGISQQPVYLKMPVWNQSTTSLSQYAGLESVYNQFISRCWFGISQQPVYRKTLVWNQSATNLSQDAVWNQSTTNLSEDAGLESVYKQIISESVNNQFISRCWFGISQQPVYCKTLVWDQSTTNLSRNQSTTSLSQDAGLKSVNNQFISRCWFGISHQAKGVVD